jgi:hypothetical protein
VACCAICRKSAEEVCGFPVDRAREHCGQRSIRCPEETSSLGACSRAPRRANVKHSQRNAELRTLQLRRREALRHFTFQALTYLDLVSNSETADAFCNLLPLMVREAYLFSCGVPPQEARPVSEDAYDFERRVEFRFRRWTTKAYQHAQMKSSTKSVRDPAKLIDLAARFSPAFRAVAITWPYRAD